MDSQVFKMYCVWTALYFPLTFYSYYKDGLSAQQILLFVRNFIFVGQNNFSWHLWYLLGIVYIVLLKVLLKKIGCKDSTVMLLAMILFFAGRIISFLLSIATTVPISVRWIPMMYSNLFVTTMNGPMFGFVYFVIGEYIAKNEVIHRNVFLYSIGFLAGLLLNGIGFFPGLIIAVTCLFVLVSQSEVKLNPCDSRMVRKISSGIYYTHMLFVSTWFIICQKIRINASFIFSFFVVISVTIISVIILLCLIRIDKLKWIEKMI